MLQSSRFRRSLARFTLKATLYGSWVLGLFPFTFDRRKHQLKRSKWLLAYGLCLNLTLLVFSVLPETDDHNSIKVEVFERNPLVRQVEYLVEIIGLLTMVLSYLRIFWRSQELTEILNELLLLEKHHFSELSLAECHKFNEYVIHKGLMIVLEIGSSLLIYFGIPESRLVVHEAVCIYVVQLEVLLVVMHFHLAVIYVYRFVWIINGQLLHLANQLRRGERGDPERVQQLRWLYGRLLELNSRLASIYDIQVTFFMGTLMSANITIGHVLVIFWINIKRFSFWIMILIFPQALIINFWDLWLCIAACNLAEKAGKATSTILKLFNDIGDMERELEERIEEFTIFCCHRKVRFRHCGLFCVNYEMGFHMIITNILYVVFLVQFDYMNLKFK
ncbi:hypothetical protein KR054_010010 [Drosophila jambulina]|nr:hypothetical protein KR054_010010 [Drosophila jambulina]